MLHGAMEPLHVGVVRSGMRPLRIGTECSGIEAPIVALRRLGIPHVHVYSTETNASAKVWSSHNYAPLHCFDDITERDAASLPPVDLYICGFPCQPYSCLNRRKKTDDTRKDVLACVLDAILQSRPRVFVLENVPAFQTHAEGALYAEIYERCAPMYDVTSRVLCPTSFGVPQSRPRLYIVGTLARTAHGDGDAFEWPRQTTDRASFTPSGANGGVTISDYLTTGMPSDVAARYSVRDKYYASKIKEWRFTEDSPTIVSLSTYGLTRAGLKGDVSPCITAAWPGLYATRLKRLLTPEETLALQGFHGVQIPPSLTHEIVRRLAGNAMSVDVVMHLFRSLLLHDASFQASGAGAAAEAGCNTTDSVYPEDIASVLLVPPIPLPPPSPCARPLTPLAPLTALTALTALTPLTPLTALTALTDLPTKGNNATRSTARARVPRTQQQNRLA